MDQRPDWRPAGLAGGLVGLLLVATTTATAVFGQAAPTAAPPAAVGIFGQATFPGKQRPAGDPAVIARGQALFGINCKACHGADLRGGDLGGPNLLRSALVLGDEAGEAIIPVVQKGRPASQDGPPMPAFPLALPDIQAISEYIHSVVGRKANQGGPPPQPEKPLNILIGDPRRGAEYFAAHCQGCHSISGDLRGIAARISNPATLQDSWVAGRRSGPRVAGAPAAPPTEVLVTLDSGDTVHGTLQHIDDFTVSLTTAQGQYRSFTRQGPQGVRAVEVHDPLQQHRQLLSEYTDRDMHDVTAYLATLK
ncbi:MAG TPA: cytochrome c [Steroidobacteraceae bacterium]|jgi:cytochrome c oxidase cbb3-type subunit 3|nr:cytochrome c [Steroidobacteraceae bacterium]